MFKKLTLLLILFPASLFPALFQEEVSSFKAITFTDPVEYLKSSYYTYTISEPEIEDFYTLDIPSLLSRIPGVEVLRRNGGVDFISLDGSRYISRFWSVDRTLLTVEGLPIAQETNFIPWCFLPFDIHDVSKMEVVRGGGSYIGSNAFLGLINIELKRPKRTGMEATVELGTQGRYLEKVVGEVSGEKGALRLSLSQEGMGNWDENDYDLFKRFYVKYWRELGPLRIEGWGGSTKGHIRRPLLAHPYMEGTTFIWDNKFLFGPYKVSIEFQQLVGSSRIPSSYSVWRHVFSQPPEKYSLKFKIGRASFERNWNVRKLNFVIGGDIKRVFSFADGFVLNTTYLIYGLYLQGTATLTSSLDFNFGLRWEKHEEIGDSLSYRAGISWTLSNNKELFVSLTSGFRNPNSMVMYARKDIKGSFTMGSVKLPFSMSIKGNRGIKPEKVNSFTASFVYKPNPSFNFVLSAFWHNFKDVYELEKSLTYPLITLSIKNSHYSDTYGLRMHISKEHAKIGKLWLSLAYQGIKIGGRKVEDTPSYIANLSWSKRWGRASSSLSFTLMDSSGEYFGKARPRCIGEAKISLRPGKGLRIGVSLFNVFNERSGEYSESQKLERTVKFFASWRF